MEKRKKHRERTASDGFDYFKMHINTAYSFLYSFPFFAGETANYAAGVRHDVPLRTRLRRASCPCQEKSQVEFRLGFFLVIPLQNKSILQVFSKSIRGF